MKKRILIVDDEVGIRLLLEDLLGSEGYEIHTAQSGKEALEKIHLHKFDLMMIDYKLPIIDGIEVIKRIDREKSPVHIIVMSGLIENIEEDTYRLIPNIKEILSKPFNVLEVRELVKQLLQE